MANTANELLTLWERAACVAGPEREDALLTAAHGAPPASLGARNAALLGMRAQLFGAAQPLRCNCPHCNAMAEFSIDCDVLAQSLLPLAGASEPQALEVEGHCIEFRVPDAADVRTASRLADADMSFAQVLLKRCVTRCERDGACLVDELPDAAAEALSHRMEELEPGANVSFDLTCPECTAQWSAPMNVGDVLWGELQWRAERLLLDVDTLARAYGWTEPEVLALSPTRRAAYLQLAGAL